MELLLMLRVTELSKRTSPGPLRNVHLEMISCTIEGHNPHKWGNLPPCSGRLELELEMELVELLLMLRVTELDTELEVKLVEQGQLEVVVEVELQISSLLGSRPHCRFRSRPPS